VIAEAGRKYAVPCARQAAEEAHRPGGWPRPTPSSRNTWRCTTTTAFPTRARGDGRHRRGMSTAPLLAVLRSRWLRLAGQLDAVEHALAAAPTDDRLPRWVRE